MGIRNVAVKIETKRNMPTYSLEHPKQVFLTLDYLLKSQNAQQRIIKIWKKNQHVFLVYIEIWENLLQSLNTTWIMHA